MFLLLFLTIFTFAKADTNDAYFHYLLGEKSYFEANFKKAIEEYDIALKYDSKSFEIKSKIAHSYNELNQKDKALKILEEIYNVKKNVISVNELYVELLIEKNEFDKALSVCKSTLDFDKNNRAANLYNALILIEKGKDKIALENLNYYIANNKDDALAYYYIGTIYLNSENTKEAEKYFLESIYVDSNYKPSVLALVKIYSSTEELGNEEKLNKLKQLVSDTGLVQNKLINLYLELAQDCENKKEELKYYKKAISELIEVEKLEPNNLETKLKLALVYTSINDYYNAKKTLSYLLKKDPSNDTVKYYLANVLYLKKEYNEAVNLYSLVDSISYLYEDSINNAAKILLDNNKISEAIDIVEKGLIKNTASIKLHDLYASLLDKAGDKTTAIKMLEKSISIYPDNEQLLYHLGTLYFETSNQDKALKLMKKIILINPDNPYALNFVAYNLIEEGSDLKTANTYISKALHYLPNDPYINDTMGWYHYKKGEFESSMYYLEKSVAILRSQGLLEETITEHLAQTYEALGYLEKSNDTYKLLLSDSNIDNKKKNEIKEYLLNNERLPASIK